MALPLPEFPERSCANCGFLATFRPPRVDFAETSFAARMRGWFGGGDVPHCFILAPDRTLWEEIKELLPPESEQDRMGRWVAEGKPFMDATASIIQRDRNCAESITWQPGYTPREHLERHMMQMERDRREQFDRDMDAANKAFLDRITERTEKTQREMAHANRIQAWMSVGALLAAIVAIVIGTFVSVRYGNSGEPTTTNNYYAVTPIPQSTPSTAGSQP